MAILIGDSILNATFVGAKYLPSGSLDHEQIRHNKAVEKHQNDYAVYHKKIQILMDWFSRAQTINEMMQ